MQPGAEGGWVGADGRVDPCVEVEGCRVFGAEGLSVPSAGGGAVGGAHGDVVCRAPARPQRPRRRRCRFRSTPNLPRQRLFSVAFFFLRSSTFSTAAPAQPSPSVCLHPTSHANAFPRLRFAGVDSIGPPQVASRGWDQQAVCWCNPAFVWCASGVGHTMNVVELRGLVARRRTYDRM